MNASAPGRGEELVEGGRSIGIGPQWLARIWSGGVSRVLDRIDLGLQRGSIEATLPGGETRLLGGRSPGFEAVVHIHSWRALLRLATSGSVGWYQAWEEGEWQSPDPVPIFALFMDNASGLGDVGRAQGPWRIAAKFLHWLHRNTRTGALRNIHAHYDLGNDFYEQWLGETMLYSSGIFPSPGGAPNALSQFVTELDVAQSNKIGAIAHRLGLDEGARVLEIGCGWGTLSAFLAETAGCACRCHQPFRRTAYLCTGPLGRTRASTRGRARLRELPEAGLPRRLGGLRRYRLGGDGGSGGAAVLAGLPRLRGAKPKAGWPGGDPVHRHAR